MTNINLLTLATDQDWEFGVDWLQIPEDRVIQLLGRYGNDLTITAAKLKRDFLVKWGNKDNQYLSISPDLIDYVKDNAMTTLIVDDSIFLNPNSIRTVNYHAIKAMERLLNWNQSGHAAGLVNSKGIQIWVNQKAGELFNDDPENLTAIDTSIYWHPADLEGIYQELKLLDPGQNLTYTYRTRCDEHFDSWYKLTNRFEVVEFAGERFRLSLNLENEPIAIPQDLQR